MCQVAQALDLSFQGSRGIAFCLISQLGNKLSETVHSVYFLLPYIHI